MQDLTRYFEWFIINNMFNGFNIINLVEGSVKQTRHRWSQIYKPCQAQPGEHQTQTPEVLSCILTTHPEVRHEMKLPPKYVDKEWIQCQ